MSIFLILAAEAADFDATDPILVLASRVAVAESDSGASATVIDGERIEALGESQAIDLLRLAPGVSVSVSGARGSQAQIRIRGSEANHSLVYVDGIAVNDPSAGNEARFETLTTGAGIGRIELIRGPQSALWGSEALGGVIAIESPDPLGGTRIDAFGEYGRYDSRRAGAWATLSGARTGVTLGASHEESDGIDILGGGTGDADGYENTTLSLLARAQPGTNGEIGLAARYIDASAEFDGSDPVTYMRADTLDNSTTETAAVRAWARLGLDPAMPWGLTVDAQYLTSTIHSYDDTDPINRVEGDRFRISGQIERRLTIGGTRHILIAAVEREDESFDASDTAYYGATDQSVDRGRTAYIGEWRGEWGDVVTTDIAVRHDDFSDFANATTFRASAAVHLTERLSLFGSWGEGIARPTFYELFGYYPGSFVGNPDVTPERSESYEIGGEWRGENFSLSVTGFSATLENEIVSVYDSVTWMSSVANASGESQRKGIEVAAALTPLPGLRIDANYSYLDADEQQVAGNAHLREVRRPRHSANVAFDYRTGPLTIGGAIAWVGARTDVDYDVYPYPTVTLGDYFLASARIGYAVTDNVEIYVRGTNLFDEEYQDVVGYGTPGRALHAGLRLRLGD